MEKYWWFFICEILFCLLFMVFAFAGSPAWLYFLGMAAWMCIMAVKEQYKKREKLKSES